MPASLAADLGWCAVRNHNVGSISLAVFIRENRVELDECIHRVVPGYQLNDSERRQWILNDERLYRWARSEGVRI